MWERGLETVHPSTENLISHSEPKKNLEEKQRSICNTFRPLWMGPIMLLQITASSLNSKNALIFLLCFRAWVQVYCKQVVGEKLFGRRELKSIWSFPQFKYQKGEGHDKVLVLCLRTKWFGISRTLLRSCKYLSYGISNPFNTNPLSLWLRGEKTDKWTERPHNWPKQYLCWPQGFAC